MLGRGQQGLATDSREWSVSISNFSNFISMNFSSNEGTVLCLIVSCTFKFWIDLKEQRVGAYPNELPILKCLCHQILPIIWRSRMLSVYFFTSNDCFNKKNLSKILIHIYKIHFLLADFFQCHCSLPNRVERGFWIAAGKTGNTV